jgi:diaminopimelate epimerase
MIAARLHGYVGSRVAVASEGGEMTVEWEPGGTLFQTGPAEYVFSGRYYL